MLLMFALCKWIYRRKDTHILGYGTCKEFNIYFLSSLTTRPKREPLLQMGLQERGYLDLGYASSDT
jgi:hypothetical protein